MLEDTYEKVACRVCGYSCAHLSSHLRSTHRITTEQYKKDYPGAPIVCQKHRDKFANNNPCYTDSFKQKMSKRMSGENNPNYGKEVSLDRRKKISDGLRGDKHPLYGKHHSDETKRKMSEKTKGKNNPMYGKSAWTGKSHSEDTKKKMAKSRVDYLSKNVFLQERTAIEQTCADILKELEIEYTEQYASNVFLYDFAIKVNNSIKVIEVQGDYWHANPNLYDMEKLQHTQTTNIERDLAKRNNIGENNILYLWESDLLKRREMCKILVKRFLSGVLTPATNSFEFKRRPVYDNSKSTYRTSDSFSKQDTSPICPQA